MHQHSITRNMHVQCLTYMLAAN